jgi:hypothetical protein
MSYNYFIGKWLVIKGNIASCRCDYTKACSYIINYMIKRIYIEDKFIYKKKKTKYNKRSLTYFIVRTKTPYGYWAARKEGEHVEEPVLSKQKITKKEFNKIINK